MNPTAIAVLMRSAAATAEETFRRIYPGTPTAAQLNAAQLAMSAASLPAIRRFEAEASKAPQNTEAHYAAAVLAILTAGVRAIVHAVPEADAPPAPSQPVPSGKQYVA